MVRTYSAGVFAGTVIKREGQEVTMKDARRIWYWDGAASLSQPLQAAEQSGFEQAKLLAMRLIEDEIDGGEECRARDAMLTGLARRIGNLKMDDK